MLLECGAAAKELAAALLSREMTTAVDKIVESMMVGLVKILTSRALVDGIYCQQNATGL